MTKHPTRRLLNLTTAALAGFALLAPGALASGVTAKVTSISSSQPLTCTEWHYALAVTKGAQKLSGEVTQAVAILHQEGLSRTLFEWQPKLTFTNGSARGYLIFPSGAALSTTYTLQFSVKTKDGTALATTRVAPAAKKGSSCPHPRGLTS